MLVGRNIDDTFLFFDNWLDITIKPQQSFLVTNNVYC